MQVILTEEEWLKLKNQRNVDNKDFIKRADIILALRELENDLRKYYTGGTIYADEAWLNIFKRFVGKLG